MSAHRLTQPAPLSQPGILTAVLHVLAGTSIQAVAADTGIGIGDLADAVQTYHAAGAAALEAKTGSGWYHARLEFADWQAAEQAVVSALVPRLRRLQADGFVAGWWFIRKHPCWRLRLHCPDQATDSAAAINAVLNDLVAAHVITRWWHGIYEPETAAFGGPAGIDIAHRLFCADSDHILRYIALPQPGLGRREISLMLCRELLASAGLDSFEQGDVWHRIATLRPIPAPQLDDLATAIRGRHSAAAQAEPPLPRSREPTAPSLTWVQAFSEAGRDLQAQAAAGRLGRGIRNILAHLVIFHWNRLGLHATSQAVLARAAAEVCLPAD